MSVLTTRRIRIGRPMPVMCDITGPATAVVIYSFGYECQDVVSCSLTTDVALSSDTCLRNTSPDALYSAQYKAHPVKINGELAFNSVLQKVPIYTKDDDCAPVGCFNIFDT